MRVRRYGCYISRNTALAGRGGGSGRILLAFFHREHLFCYSITITIFVMVVHQRKIGEIVELEIN